MVWAPGTREHKMVEDRGRFRGAITAVEKLTKKNTMVFFLVVFLFYLYLKSGEALPLVCGHFLCGDTATCENDKSDMSAAAAASLIY